MSRLRPPLGLLAAIALATALAATPASARPYEDGTVIEITGLVTDREGRPIPQAQVLLEASRRRISFTKLRRVNDSPVRVSALTDDGGEYTIRWKWHRYYNHFELRVVVAVRRPGGRQHLEVLAEVDLSERIKQGSPVVAPVTVEDTSFLDTYRSFLAAIDTDDERQVFDAMGKPDKVETLKFPDRREESWWYFKMGRTYRFRDGDLTQVVEFDPVTEF